MDAPIIWLTLLVFLKELDESFYYKVVIGNGQHFKVKDKWVMTIETLSDIKYIFDILFLS